MPPPAVSILGAPFSAVQLLKGKFPDGNANCIVQLESNLNVLKIAGLSPAGRRLFILSYQNRKLDAVISPMTKMLFEPEYMLRDIFLILAPFGELKKLVPGWSVVQTSNVRQIKSPCGLDFIIERSDENSYEKACNKGCRYILKRTDDLYSLEITTLEYQSLK